MEIQEQKGYNIFTALHETIHNQSLRKLQFAKCQECGRLTPFRLISVEKETITCKKCGSLVTVRTKK
jgi:DNA-directed RNA polymerase subunit RPC12/RpoP